MSDTQAAMREFRFLDEKRKTNGLTPAEQERWQQLGASLGVEVSQPDPSTQGYYGQDGQWYQYPPGYDANAWAAQQAGGWPGYYPPQGYYDPNTGAWYPYPAYYDPNTGAYYPAQPGYGYPPQQGWPQAPYGSAPQWPQEAYQQQGGWPQQPAPQAPQEPWANPAQAPYQAPVDHGWPSSEPAPQSQAVAEAEPAPQQPPEPAPTLIEEPRAAAEEPSPAAVSFEQSRASGLRTTPYFGSPSPPLDAGAVSPSAPPPSTQAAPRSSSPSGFAVLGSADQTPSDPAPPLRFPSKGFFAPASNPAFQPLPPKGDDEVGDVGLLAEPEPRAEAPETTPLLAELRDEDASPLLDVEAANDTPLSAPTSNGLPLFSSLGSTPEISSDEVMDLDGARSDAASLEVPPARSTPQERLGRAPASEGSHDDVMEIQDEEVVEIIPSASAPPSVAPPAASPPPPALDSVEDLRSALSLEDEGQQRPAQAATWLNPPTPTDSAPEPKARPFLADVSPEPTAPQEKTPAALLDLPEAPPERSASPEPLVEPPAPLDEAAPLSSFLEMDVLPEAPLAEAPETIEALPEVLTGPLEEVRADEPEPITLVSREVHDEVEPLTLIPKRTLTPLPTARPIAETTPVAPPPEQPKLEPWPVAPPSSPASKYPQVPSLAPPPSPSAPAPQALAPPPSASHPFPDFQPLNPPTSPTTAKPFSQFRPITAPPPTQTPEALPSAPVSAGTPSAFDGLALPPDASPIPTFSEPLKVPEDRDTSPYGLWTDGKLEPLPEDVAEQALDTKHEPPEEVPSQGEAKGNDDWGDLPVVEAEHAETPLEGSPSDKVELAGPAEFVQWSHDPMAPDTHDFHVDTDLTGFVLESGPAAALATGVSATATSGFDAEPVPLATNAEFLTEPEPTGLTLPWPTEPEAPAEEEPLVEGELIPEVEGELEGELDVDVDFAGPPFSPPPPPPSSRPLAQVDAPTPQHRPSQPLPPPIAVEPPRRPSQPLPPPPIAVEPPQRPSQPLPPPPMAAEPQRRPPQPLPTPAAPAPSFPRVPPLSEPMAMPIPTLSPPGALSAAAAAAKLGTSPVPLNPPLVAPAPSPPRTEMTPVMIEGEHRVILHTMEGGVKRGAIRDVNLASAQVILQTNPGVNESVPRERVKAIFFMLAPGSRAPEPEGIKVRVTFRDGRQVAGYSKDHRSGASGFFVVPADHRTNTERIFIYRHSVTSVSVES